MYLNIRDNESGVEDVHDLHQIIDTDGEDEEDIETEAV